MLIFINTYKLQITTSGKEPNTDSLGISETINPQKKLMIIDLV